MIESDLYCSSSEMVVQKDTTSTIIPDGEKEKYLDAFNRIKAKNPEPRDRMETPLEREARMSAVYREMGKVFVLEERH